MKCLSIATATLPLGGCAIAIGLIFAGLVQAEAYSPDSAGTLFARAMLGFALVETFMVVVLGLIGLIVIF